MYCLLSTGVPVMFLGNRLTQADNLCLGVIGWLCHHRVFVSLLPQQPINWSLQWLSTLKTALLWWRRSTYWSTWYYPDQDRHWDINLDQNHCLVSDTAFTIVTPFLISCCIVWYSIVNNSRNKQHLVVNFRDDRQQDRSNAASSVQAQGECRYSVDRVIPSNCVLGDSKFIVTGPNTLQVKWLCQHWRSICLLD